MPKYFYLFLILFSIASCGTFNHNRLQFSKTQTKNNVTKSDLKLDEVAKDESYSNDNFENISDNDIASSSTDIIEVIDVKETIKVSDCDKLLLRDGEEISVKVVEIGTKEIKYKNCDNQQGPAISISKSDVFMITYPNGSKDVFKEEIIIDENQNKSTSQNNTGNIQKKTNGFAIASFVFGLLGIIPILGIVFGAIANNQITKNPDLYTGRGLATFGIVLSILWLIIILVLFL